MMTGMPKPKHANTDTGLRRARAAAWTVFLSMAGTTIAFQVYHAVKVGQMPRALAVLFGIVLLAICILVLEFVAQWTTARIAVKVAAYSLVAGAMYMSAGATSEVVVHAAPPHMSLLFGLLLDGAALLAVHFLLSGSPAVSRAHAEAEAARRAELDEIRAARRAAEDERDAMRAELAETAARAQDAEAARIQADADRTARGAAEDARDEAVRALAETEAKAGAAVAKAERLERKLGGPKGRSAGGLGRSRTAAKTGTGTGGGTAPEDEVDLESRALKLLATDLEMSGAELARQLGVTEGYGRKLRRRLTDPDRPSEAERDRPQDRDGTAREDRTEDRS